LHDPLPVKITFGEMREPGVRWVSRRRCVSVRVALHSSTTGSGRLKPSGAREDNLGARLALKCL
jgi:hypothetical protein